MVVVYDLEILKNFFLYVDYELESGNINQFEISEYRNDLPDLLKHLRKITGQIGFNNIAFDSQIQQFILSRPDLLKMTGLEVALKLHFYTKDIIEKMNQGKFSDYPEWKLSIKQLDLFKVWHYDNEGRSCSLKWLQFSMDWHNVEDMPLGHLDPVTSRQQADEIIGYCKNDVLSTHNFYLITKGETDLPLYKGINKLDLRKDVSKKFGVNCINFSDVKIGDEINKINYIKNAGIQWNDFRQKRPEKSQITFSQCAPNYLEFKTEELSKFWDSIKDYYIDAAQKQEFKFKFADNNFTFAKGGLHTIDSPRLIIPDEDVILRDADVGSMYPNAIRKRRLFPRQHGPKWLDGYSEIIEERIRAKDLYEQTKEPGYKSIAEAFKLALNGGSFGKTNDPSNWQYDPLVQYSVTIGCQIDLLMLIESLYLGGIRIMSANTDGVLSMFHSCKEEDYKKICSDWEVKVGNNELGKLEYIDYKLVAQRNISDYLGLTTKNKCKYKGDFTVDFELHKNKSFRVVKLALEQYYTKGTNPVQFIKNHKNIFDFCGCVKSKSGIWYEQRSIENGTLVGKKLTKNTRYYVSTTGTKLVKCFEDGRERQVDAGKWLCTVYNKHELKDDYNIDYDFYIKKTYDIIMEIDPSIVSVEYKQQTLF